MSVSKPFIANALKRLNGKPYPPSSEEVMAEVVKVVERLAEDEEHVSRIIDKVLTIPGSYPEPAIFAQCANSTATQVYMADPLCKSCGGCGYVSKMVGSYPGSKKCNCWARRPQSLRPWLMGDEAPELPKLAQTIDEIARQA